MAARFDRALTISGPHQQIGFIFDHSRKRNELGIASQMIIGGYRSADRSTNNRMFYIDAVKVRTQGSGASIAVLPRTLVNGFASSPSHLSREWKYKAQA